MTFIRIIPFITISLLTTSCSDSKAKPQPIGSVEVVEAEIEIIDNTKGYAIILD